MIHAIEKSFVGKGEIKGMKFSLLNEIGDYFLWAVVDNNQTHYEVWKKKVTPVCVDFENRVYSDTEYKFVKPKSKDFGVWAWSFYNLEQLYKKFKFVP